MKQQTAQASTLESLGLAAWTPTSHADDPAAALGSLSGVLGEFLPSPSPRFVVPAQRTGTLFEALR